MFKSACVIAAALAFSLPAHSASVLFSNLLEPGGQYGPDAVGFGSIPGSTPEQRDRAMAVRFSVPTDALLSYFQVSIDVRSGTNLLSGYLLADASGLPGSVIEAYTIEDLPSGFPPPLTTVPSASRPLLKAGVDYWFAIKTEELDTFGGWTLTSFRNNPWSSDNLAVAGLIGDPQSGWILGIPGGREGTLVVAGTAVPEPATVLTSAAALLLLARRRYAAPRSKSR